MKMMSRWMVLAVVGALGGTVGAKTSAPLSGEEREHATSIHAKLTLRSGATRTVTLEGVGCSSSMCSRVFLNSATPGDAAMSRTWLDSIAAIKDITPDDALFVFRNGTQSRLSVIPVNRVLYIKDQRGVHEKLDLTRLSALEFGPLASR